jgi:hypothetical protein
MSSALELRLRNQHVDQGQNAMGMKRDTKKKKPDEPEGIDQVIRIPLETAAPQTPPTEKPTTKASPVTVAALFAGIAIATLCFLQLLTMQNSIEETRRNFRQDERAWMGVTETDMNFASSATEESFIITKVRNTGKTPALRVVSQIYMQEFPAGQRPNFLYRKPPNTPAGVVMPNGLITLHTGRVLPIPAIKNGTVSLFHYGSIWYCDVFRKEHRTDFCNEFHPDQGIFGACSFHEDIDQETNDATCN